MAHVFDSQRYAGNAVFLSNDISSSPVSVSGDTVTLQASLIAGAATGAAFINGITLEQSISLMAGSVTIGTSVSGDVVTQTSSLIAGAATGAASVSGNTVGLGYSLIAGTVTVGSLTLTLTQADIDAIVAAIFAQAAVTPIYCNVQQVNDITLIGTGVPGDSMRPA